MANMTALFDVLDASDNDDLNLSTIVAADVQVQIEDCCCCCCCC
jgi:hypothetical protein